MPRPKLNEIPLSSAVPIRQGTISMTIDVGAWDKWIENAYNMGSVLIEMDQHERPIRAFQKREAL
jgi:hypothetical protein